MKYAKKIWFRVCSIINSNKGTELYDECLSNAVESFVTPKSVPPVDIESSPTQTATASSEPPFCKWPLSFFGKPCFDCASIEESKFVGPMVMLGDGVEFEKGEMARWPKQDQLEIEAITLNGEDDFMVGRDRQNQNNIYLLKGGAVIGSYGQRSLIVHPEFRRKHYTRVLVLAKATALNGSPAEGRKYSKAGLAAVRSAYLWAVQMNCAQKQVSPCEADELHRTPALGAPPSKIDRSASAS